MSSLITLQFSPIPFVAKVGTVTNLDIAVTSTKNAPVTVSYYLNDPDASIAPPSTILKLVASGLIFVGTVSVPVTITTTPGTPLPKWIQLRGHATDGDGQADAQLTAQVNP